jgi:hypothetical protein
MTNKRMATRLREWVGGCAGASRVAALCLAFASGATVAADFSEEAIKAAYLHRFASYVYWPAGTPASTPFVIGVFGADAVATELERLLPLLTAESRPAVVRRLRPGMKPGQLHILYVGPGHLADARDLLLTLEREPVLIVTDDENGLARGGMINFVRVNRNVRFEVSVEAARTSGLQMSSGLLSVAARIEGEGRGSGG